MSTSAATGILGQAEQAAAATKTASSSMDKEAFLKLLVTQLGHQDPLNPMEDKEFVAELSQFSSLEQLTNLNSNMETLITATQRQDMISAVSFMGKTVKAEGNQLSKSGDSVSELSFSLDEAASAALVNISDSDGNIIRTVDLGSLAAGSHTFTWDGLDWQGEAVDDGVYTASVAAENASGEIMTVTTEVTGKVSGIDKQNGQYMLRLDNGRSVDFLSITEVKDAADSSADES